MVLFLLNKLLYFPGKTAEINCTSFYLVHHRSNKQASEHRDRVDKYILLDSLQHDSHDCMELCSLSFGKDLCDLMRDIS